MCLWRHVLIKNGVYIDKQIPIQPNIRDKYKTPPTRRFDNAEVGFDYLYQKEDLDKISPSFDQQELLFFTVF